MPSWRWAEVPGGELSSAFDTYNDIFQGKIDYREVFEKYNIQTVLWQKPLEGDKFKEFVGKVENYLSSFGYKKNDFDFLKKLEEDGWNKIHEDDSSVIYSMHIKVNN
jgi:hypothetical protein